jgi:transcription antitermination factor NusG
MGLHYSATVNQHSAESGAWCALYTRHQHEKAVAQALTRKGFEVFLPLYKTARCWSDRNKVLTLPLFPCYIFVRGGATRRLDVLATPGVHMILRRGEDVAAVPEEDIDALRKAVTGPHQVEPYPFLKCGGRARIIRGPLAGLEGILIRKKNLCRLILSVEMVAQSVAVDIEASEVESIP